MQMQIHYYKDIFSSGQVICFAIFTLQQNSSLLMH